MLFDRIQCLAAMTIGPLKAMADRQRPASCEMRFRVAFIVGMLVICGYCGCITGVMPRECREFFALSSRDREIKFRQYPLDKQVDLYLCGMNREPPESGYAAYIAEGGESVIPYLLTRLKREPLEISQARIIDIFTVLAAKGSLRNRQDMVVELEEVISKMTYEPVKSTAQGYLGYIKTENSRAR